MARVKLTVKMLDNIKAGAGRIQVFDTEQPGLCLRVSPSGEKSFSVVYKRLGRMRRWTIGKYPSVTLVNARLRARKALISVADGKDPQEQKVTERDAETVECLLEDYIEQHAKPNKDSWREDERMVNAYLLPVWKHLKVSQITRSDCEVLLEKIAETGPVQANRVRSLLNHVFVWVLQKETRRIKYGVSASPCVGIPKAVQEKARKRAYSDAELQALWKAFTAIGTVGDLFRLQLYTGCRPGEVSNMQWTELNLEQAIWTLPSEKTKTDQPHIVPLSSAAVKVLQSLRTKQSELKNERKRTSPFIFQNPRRPEEPIKWLHAAALRVREAAVINDFRPHDCRRSVGTRLAKMRVPREVRKMILNHTLGKNDVTDSVYNVYDYMEERRQALETWSKELLRIVSGLHVVEVDVNEA